MPIVSGSSKHAWYADLRHGGMLISPPLLDETFPNGPLQPSQFAYERLRDRFNAFGAWLEKHGGVPPSQAEPLHSWLDSVLEDFLGYEKKRWLKGSNIHHDLTVETALGDRLRPQRVLLLDDNESKPALALWIDRSRQLGMGRGRSAYSKLIEFLRGSPMKLGLLTNGSQFRLCYAGLDHDSWIEWDAENWFDEGELRDQLYGFLTLLGPPAFAGRAEEFPLLTAVQSSRSRQGELSTVLGEQVRRAVELLLLDLDRAARRDPMLLDRLRRPTDGPELSRKQELDALYQAASRIVMRIVVILYAEARGLLPRNLQNYNSAYGLEGLFEQLRRARTHEGYLTLNDRVAAWPRIISLFKLVHEGSSHAHLPVPSYGGLLFRMGDAGSPDNVQRAVSVLEDTRLETSDFTVLQILELLKIGTMKIRRGRTSSLAKGPVDFSELRTEYIGILYEGLLDYELKSADKTMVFLNLGQQPILPLDILDNMSDADLKNLLDKLSKEKASGSVAGGEDETSEDEESVESAEESEEPESAQPETAEEEIQEEDPEADDVEYDDTRTEADLRLEQAHTWALRAVEVAGLVRRPRGRNVNLYHYERDKQAAARRLILRVLDQGEFYLARWGGTRKGSGTFYTKPGLAVPTVHRTLEPLVYEKSEDGKLIPKSPDDILAVKVCDPACGSGSFLVAALNYLTEALFQSLLFHRRIREAEKEVVVTLPFGTAANAGIAEETLPVPPTDERFEPMLKARLKRHVVERCIYGVDFNPMAVELCRLSLWVETMDPTLPFGFLDHKIKCGNALVGCWFDRFLDYPLAAWLRKSGDENHTRGVHFEKEEWSKRIKAILNERVKPELIRQIEAHKQPTFEFMPDARAPETLHDEAVAIFEKLHSLSVATPDGIEQREQIYRRDFVENPTMEALREAFDLWCSVWFWPADYLGDEAPTPANFYEGTEVTRMIVGQLKGELRFFHWELEFPDVFVSVTSGFNAVIGNPPWETAKPNSMEFFSNYDPVYRAYGKQEALGHQASLFRTSIDIEREWLTYRARFKGMSNWIDCVASPFGDPEGEHGESVSLVRGRGNITLHRVWREQRSNRRGYADIAHPYRHQGSADINTYKMFCELSHVILTRGGRLGMIAPSALYTDKGSTALRQLFLDFCQWDWLFGFINWNLIFNIYYRFKFCIVVLSKGDRTDSVKVGFGRYEIEDWENAERYVIDLPVASIARFSPISKVIIEPRTRRDLQVIEKIYDSAVLLGERTPRGWQIRYATEFHMTNDSSLFPPRPKWEEKNYRPDSYGRWLKGSWRKIEESPEDGLRARIAGKTMMLQQGIIPSVYGDRFIRVNDIEDIALPLYEGRMVGQFDFSQKGWVSGKGRTAVWREIPWDLKTVEPQYLMGLTEILEAETPVLGFKMPLMNISSATNARTMVAAFAKDWPCGHALNPARLGSLRSTLGMVSVVNSFAYDYSTRVRVGGLNISFFVLDETPVIRKEHVLSQSEILISTARLSLCHNVWAPEWLQLTSDLRDSSLVSNNSWHKAWALTEYERLRLRCILDAVVAELYGLSFDDFSWILRNDPSDPKGFWRVDQHQPLELRQTTLALAAFRDLKEMGLDAFCAMPDREGLPGCGWQIPETLKFAVRDQGIIKFDALEGDPYTVRERLGPRFLPWQLEGTPEESWAECELHARNILGEAIFKRLMAQLNDENSEASEAEGPEPVLSANGNVKLFATGHPNLFGEDTTTKVRRRKN